MVHGLNYTCEGEIVQSWGDILFNNLLQTGSARKRYLFQAKGQYQRIGNSRVEVYGRVG